MIGETWGASGASVVRVASALACGCAAVVVARRARRAAVITRLPAAGKRRLRLPAPVRERICDALDASDLPVDPSTAMQCWLVAVVAATLVAAAVVPQLTAIALVGALIAPPTLLRLTRDRSDRRVAAGLAEALRSVGGELGAGGTVRTAIGRLARAPSPVQRDLSRVEARLQLGASLAAAFEAWPRERPLPGVRVVAGALVATAALGGAAAGPLEGLAASLADRHAIAAEARSLSAQARVSAIVVGVAPLGYLALSAALDGGAVNALVATGVGRLCMVVGLVLDLLAIAWMRRIVREPRWSW